MKGKSIEGYSIWKAMIFWDLKETVRILDSASIPKHYPNYGWKMKTEFDDKSGASPISDHSLAQ